MSGPLVQNFFYREEFEEEIDALRVKNAEKGVQMKQIELKLHEEEEGRKIFRLNCCRQYVISIMDTFNS